MTVLSDISDSGVFTQREELFYLLGESTGEC